MKVLTTTRWN